MKYLFVLKFDDKKTRDIVSEKYETREQAERTGDISMQIFNADRREIHVLYDDGRKLAIRECDTCEGSGSHLAFTSFALESVSDICPMCDGKGERFKDITEENTQ